MYFEKDNRALQLDLGDKIVFHTKISEFQNSGNPYEFDYKDYLLQHKVQYSAYIKLKNWKLLAKNKSEFYRQIPYNFRKKLLALFDKYEITGQQKALISALTLGYKEDLSNETRYFFAASGAMHLLAVSGLHVGIVYQIIFILLARVLKIRNKMLRWILTVIAIWFFAFLTGASPSVCRAALMFTMVDLGICLKRSSNIYNIIATSAFILLLINPFTLFSVGFQLSYIAVLSIIKLFPLIYKLLYIKSNLLDYCWQLTSVTISAQIGTIPFTLYYFNIFPVYTLISNLVITQLATGLMILTILFFSFAFSAWAMKYIAIILNFFAQKMIQFTTFNEQLPFSVISDIALSKFDVVLLFVLIISILYYFEYEKPKSLLLSSFCILGLMSLKMVKTLTCTNQKKFMVYNAKKTSLYAFFDGTKVYCYADNKLWDKPVEIKRTIGNHLLHENIRQLSILKIARLDTTYSEACILRRGNFTSFYTNITIVDDETPMLSYKNIVFFAKKSFVFVNRRTLFNYIPTKVVDVDYLVLGKNTRKSIEELLSYFKPKQIIIDSEISTIQKNIWKEECQTHQISCLSVHENGAYKAILN